MGIINKDANLYNHRGKLIAIAGCYQKDYHGCFMPETVGQLCHKTNKKKKSCRKY